MSGSSPSCLRSPGRCGRLCGAPIRLKTSTAAKFTRNVRRWRDGSMILRWVGSALLDADQQFRRVRGYREMPALIEALRQHVATGETKEER